MDELKEMTVEEAYQKGLEDSQKIDKNVLDMALKGTISEALSHDFNSQSFCLKSCLLFMEKGLDEDELDREDLQNSLKDLKAHWRSLENMIRRLGHLSWSRYRDTFTGQELWEDLEPLVYTEGTEFELTPEFRDHEFYLNKGAIIPVLFNVLQNAQYWAREDKGEGKPAPKGLKAKVRIHCLPNGVITVCDNGPGLTLSDHTLRRLERGHITEEEAELQRLSQPFQLGFSMRRGCSNKGIGLWASKTLLEDKGGRLYVTEDPELQTMRGACFCIQPEKIVYMENVFFENADDKYFAVEKRRFDDPEDSHNYLYEVTYYFSPLTLTSRGDDLDKVFQSLRTKAKAMSKGSQMSALNRVILRAKKDLC